MAWGALLMLGRVVGVLAGLILIAFGAALWRPDLVPHGVVLGVGPFAPYKSEVSGLMAAVGAVGAVWAKLAAAKVKLAMTASDFTNEFMVVLSKLR